VKDSSLKRLFIEHLRGSVQPFNLTFDPGKRLTVIYGENGTGKSTICDALEFLGKGWIGSLDNRGLGSTTKYWSSLGKKAGDVSVCLETGSSTCTARLNKSQVIASPPEHRPRVEVLRRSRILSLIEAKPAERYAAISRFVDVSAIERSEASLRALIRDLENQQRTAAARVEENEHEITRSWETAGKPAPDPISWALHATAGGIVSHEPEIKAIRELQAGFKRMGEYQERIRTTEAELKRALEVEASEQRNLGELTQRVALDAGETVAVLEAAAAFLAKFPSPAVCPLCESSHNAPGLAERTVQRLKSFTELQASQGQVKVAAKRVAEARQRLVVLNESVKTDRDEFEKRLRKHKWSDELPAPKPVPDDAGQLEQWLRGHAGLMDGWHEREQSLLAQEMQANSIVMARKTWQANSDSLKALGRLVPRLEKALEIIEEERREFTDRVLSAIADEVGRLYEVVHPGEGLNKVSLELDPKKRASLEIEAGFYGKRAAPQAYFSESHLDTLGLCIFLALSGMDKPEETILVLDDLLSSVDTRHMERVLDLFCSEVRKFRHCVVTTHHPDWKERWSTVPGAPCQIVELADWSIDHGIQIC
jgi:ABC-type dipeptide/oligopeptide/nickel transport system ATPase subunit